MESGPGWVDLGLEEMFLKQSAGMKDWVGGWGRGVIFSSLKGFFYAREEFV